ncbi:MAG: 50S ribosomal protein L13 [bacterium]
MPKSFVQKPADLVREWHLIDLDGQILGRAATNIARLLIGKHRPFYTNHVDCGDFVVVINADKLVLTGNKMLDKVYPRHSGHPGGFKSPSITAVMKKNPALVVRASVKGMIPKNKLAALRLRRLKIYSGSDHPHTNHFAKKES